MLKNAIKLFLASALFSLITTFSWAATLQVDVEQPQSNLNLSLADQRTQIGSIRGQIRTDVATTAQVYVNETEIVFSSGTQSFTAYLTGTIGGNPVSTAPMFIPVEPGSPLLIDLQFSIPPGQFKSGVAAAGNYLATPLLIYAISD